LIIFTAGAAVWQHELMTLENRNNEKAKKRNAEKLILKLKD